MATLKVDLDGLKKRHWTPEGLKNVELVADFVQKLMNDHDFDGLRSNSPTTATT